MSTNSGLRTHKARPAAVNTKEKALSAELLKARTTETK
jgi:hypothetical protein